MRKKCVVSLFKWKSIKDEYVNAFRAGSNFSPFVSPIFIKCTLKHKMFFSKSRFKHFVVAKGIFQNGVVYAPLLVDKSTISLLGDYTSASYTSFVFSRNIKSDDLSIFVDELCKLFKKDFVFEKIMPSNSTYDSLNLTKGTLCMKVDFGSDFTDYFNSLTKSVRQNYRTAINRINREGKRFSIRFFINEKIPRNYKKRLLSLYVKRSKHWDDNNKRFINRVHRRYFDLMNNSLDQIENSFCSIILIDNNICGFMMGAFNNDYSVCTIPRLAIDSKYGVYCPGLVLIIDTIKKLTTIQCNCLDLSRGNEQYKYRAGAKEYNLLSGAIKYKDDYNHRL